MSQRARKKALLVALATGACHGGADPYEAPACLRSLTIVEGDDPLAYSVAWSPVSFHALGGTEHELRLMVIEDEGHRLRVADRLVGTHPYQAVVWMPDGTKALSASGDGRVYLLDVDVRAESLSVLTSVEVDAQGLLSVALSPDGRHGLACGVDGTVSLLRVDAQAPALNVTDRFAAHERCLVVRWAADGHHAVSLGLPDRALVYRVDTEAEDLEALGIIEVGEVPGAVGFGRDEHELVIGTFGAGHRVSYGSLDLQHGSFAEHQTFDDFQSGLKVIEPAHDPSVFVIAAHDGAPRLYHRTDEPGLQSVDRLDDDGSGSHAVAWSPDDGLLIRAASQLDRFEVLATRGCATE